MNRPLPAKSGNRPAELHTTIRRGELNRYVGLLHFTTQDGALDSGLDSVSTKGAGEPFESLSMKGRYIYLVSLQSEAAGRTWVRQIYTEMNKPNSRLLDFKVQVVEVERDYGMFDRKEAPQFYPPIIK